MANRHFGIAEQVVVLRRPLLPLRLSREFAGSLAGRLVCESSHTNFSDGNDLAAPVEGLDADGKYGWQANRLTIRVEYTGSGLWSLRHRLVFDGPVLFSDDSSDRSIDQSRSRGVGGGSRFPLEKPERHLGRAARRCASRWQHRGTSPVFSVLGFGLWLVWFHGAFAGDRVVPSARNHTQIQLAHVRSLAWNVFRQPRRRDCRRRSMGRIRT